MAGDPLTLMVEVLTLPNNIFAKWSYNAVDEQQYFNGSMVTVVVTGAETSQTTLSITYFEEAYFGNITCSTSNAVGLGDNFTYIVSPLKGKQNLFFHTS